MKTNRSYGSLRNNFFGAWNTLISIAAKHSATLEAIRRHEAMLEKKSFYSSRMPYRVSYGHLQPYSGPVVRLPIGSLVSRCTFREAPAARSLAYSRGMPPASSSRRVQE